MAQNPDGEVPSSEENSSVVSGVIADIIYSPLNLGLLAICVFLLYKIFFSKKPDISPAPVVPQLPPLKKRDMTYAELKQYDGLNEEGRVCVGVNGKVFDVTKGKRFYGPGNTPSIIVTYVLFM